MTQTVERRAFLDAAELTALTGYTRPSAQEAWLKARGFNVARNGIGRVMLAREALERWRNGAVRPDHHEGAHEAQKPFDGEIPDVWLQKNIEGLLFSRDDILKKALDLDWDNLPRESGIYFLINDDVDYVGVSRDPHFRIVQHFRGGKRFSRVFFIGVPELLMEDVEALYIHALTPPWNTKYPPMGNLEKHLAVIVGAHK
jgi:hypothetical protein